MNLFNDPAFRIFIPIHCGSGSTHFLWRNQIMCYFWGNRYECVENLRKISPNEVTQQNITAYNFLCFTFHKKIGCLCFNLMFHILWNSRWQCVFLGGGKKVVVLVVKPSFTFCFCNKKRNKRQHFSHFSHFPPFKDLDLKVGHNLIWRFELSLALSMLDNYIFHVQGSN